MQTSRPPISCRADLIHVSEGRFSHLFKESAGMAPLQYINKVRLEKAANLLKRGDYTVAEVANAVGFSDYNHFGRLFRRAKIATSVSMGVPSQNPS